MLAYRLVLYQNVTVAAAQTTYAPNGTPSVAIRSTVAPNWYSCYC